MKHGASGASNFLSGREGGKIVHDHARVVFLHNDSEHIFRDGWVYKRRFALPDM
jgi:hypothetical protein